VTEADGTEPVQVTIRLTPWFPVSNSSPAVAAGPRATSLAAYPGCGLHEIKKAPAVPHMATTLPPGELSSVPAGATAPGDEVRGAVAAGRVAEARGVGPGDRSEP